MIFGHQFLSLNLSHLPHVAPASEVSKRLVKAFGLLDRLDFERASRRNPHFGKLLEQRIIMCELLDLELQEIDEQIQRITKSAGTDSRT